MSRVAVSIASRSSWGGDSIIDVVDAVSQPVDEVYLHHTAERLGVVSVANEQASMRGIEGYVRSARGYPCYPYTVGVMLSGRMYAGTVINGVWYSSGCHTCNHNNTFAICVHANLMEEELTDAAVLSIRKLIAHMKGRNICTNNVKVTPHSDVGVCGGGGTACPGDSARARLSEIREPYEGDDLTKGQAEQLQNVARWTQGHKDGYAGTTSQSTDIKNDPFYKAGRAAGVQTKKDEGA